MTQTARLILSAGLVFFATNATIVLALLVPSAGSGAGERRATRIIFSATGAVAGDQQIYSIEPSGRGLAQLTVGPGTASDPLPSPDGRRIAFLRHESNSTSIWVMRPNGAGQRKIVDRGADPAWVPNSRRVVYVALSPQGERLGIRETAADGGSNRLLVSGSVSAPTWSPDRHSLAFVLNDSLIILNQRPERRQSQVVIGGVYDSGLTWSPDGRWIAYQRRVGEGLNAHREVQIVRPDGSQRRSLGPGYGPVWSPNGRLLAFLQGPPEWALSIADVRTGASRRFSPFSARAVSWSPDGSRLAYVDATVDKGVIGTVSLDGRRRTILPRFPDADAVSWTRAPARLRYRAPLPLMLTGETELRFRKPVSGVAADGDRLAYHVCNMIGVWRPSRSEAVPVRPQWPLCGHDSTLFLGGLALAGNQVAWGALQGGNSKSGWLTVAPVAANAPQTVVSAPPGRTSGDPRGNARSGYLVGDDSLLVFSTWAFCDDLGRPCSGIPVTDGRILTQTLWRVREPSWSGACPIEVPRAPHGLPIGRCQELRTEPGPLVPFDVNEGRVVAGGDNATVLLDEVGRELLSIPVSAVDAQLAGSDLVLLVGDRLQHYDASTRVLLKAWPLPGVPGGIEDAARGFVAYILDGELRLLRLSDGRDVVLDATRPRSTESPLRVARFGDSGLFYTYEAASPWQGRIRFVPFDELPLR